MLGAWIGGYASNDVLGVLFFGAAAGAALQVVVEVGRFVARRAPGGLRSGLGDRRLSGRDRGHVPDRPARRLNLGLVLHRTRPLAAGVARTARMPRVDADRRRRRSSGSPPGRTSTPRASGCRRGRPGTRCRRRSTTGAPAGRAGSSGARRPRRRADRSHGWSGSRRRRWPSARRSRGSSGSSPRRCRTARASSRRTSSSPRRSFRSSSRRTAA